MTARLAWIAVVIGLVCSSRAGNAEERTPERVQEAAERVWWAFAGGIAPPVEEGRAAREILDAHAASLSEPERGTTRLHVDPVAVMLAKAAWAARDPDASAARAKAVLAALEDAPRWDRGNLLHEMRILLGRLALERGDLTAARGELLMSAQTSGSPQLDSFGPDWTLAEDLLAKGERAAVVAYIDAVGKFWESGRDRLATWKKELEDGKTPKFVPRRDGNVPPRAKKGPFPPPVAPAEGILGLWESTSTSRGGIGSAIEFLADGTVRTRPMILHNGTYRIDGDRLAVGAGSESASVPLGTIENDRWTIEAEDGTRVVKQRLGAPTPNQPLIVGIWTMAMNEHTKTYERYRADGWIEYRMPMPGLSTGSYEKAGDTVRMKLGDAPAQELKTAIEGDRLRLTSANGENHEYRYAGAKSWYPFARDP